MEKDFDGWNKIKKKTNAQKQSLFFHEREVWLIRMGANIGHEQDGAGHGFVRPMVIMRVFNKDTFFGVGLTGRKKFGAHYTYVGVVAKRDATANLSQVRLIDTRRLVKKIDTVNEKTFLSLREALKKNLFP